MAPWPPPFPTPMDYRTRMYHPLHLMIPSSYTLFYQKSYFPRTIVDWNNLATRQSY